MRKPRRGDGIACLVVDRVRTDYHCYWYAGANDAHLVEHARAATASAAVAWGRQRTARVRIRTEDARTYWAGTGPRPDGFRETWADPTVATAPVDHTPATPAPGTGGLRAVA